MSTLSSLLGLGRKIEEYPQFIVFTEDDFYKLSDFVKHLNRSLATSKGHFTRMKRKFKCAKILQEMAESGIIEQQEEKANILAHMEVKEKELSLKEEIMSTTNEKLKVCRVKTGEMRAVIRQYEENWGVKLLRALKILKVPKYLDEKHGESVKEHSVLKGCPIR